MNPRQAQVALAILVILPMILIVYSESVADPESTFAWIYGGLVIGETLVLLSFAMLLARLSTRNPGSFLARRVQLPRPVRVIAMLSLLAGLCVLAFWVMVDLLSGYHSFPAYSFAAHPLTLAIYNDMGLGSLPLPDKNRALGLLSFGVAVLCFIALRAEKGIGVAVRDGLLFFAAPIMIVFELALWYFAPAEMYWHATTFVPWSLGRYLTPAQFLDVTYSRLTFVWGGNVYLMSNWLVLLSASSLFALGVARAWRRTHPA